MYSKRCSAGHSAQFRTGLNRLGALELGARDLVVFAEVDAADAASGLSWEPSAGGGNFGGGWGRFWPLASPVGGASAFLHGHEDHSASLALVILVWSAFNSSLPFSSSAGSGACVWAGVGVVGCRRSGCRLASKPAAIDRPRGLIAILARFWLICGRSRGKR